MRCGHHPPLAAAARSSILPDAYEARPPDQQRFLAVRVALAYARLLIFGRYMCVYAWVHAGMASHRFALPITCVRSTWCLERGAQRAAALAHYAKDVRDGQKSRRRGRNQDGEQPHAHAHAGRAALAQAAQQQGRRRRLLQPAAFLVERDSTGRVCAPIILYRLMVESAVLINRAARIATLLLLRKVRAREEALLLCAVWAQFTGSRVYCNRDKCS